MCRNDLLIRFRSFQDFDSKSLNFYWNETFRLVMIRLGHIIIYVSKSLMWYSVFHFLWLMNLILAITSDSWFLRYMRALNEFSIVFCFRRRWQRQMALFLEPLFQVVHPLVCFFCSLIYNSKLLNKFLVFVLVFVVSYIIWVILIMLIEFWFGEKL